MLYITCLRIKMIRLVCKIPKPTMDFIHIQNCFMVIKNKTKHQPFLNQYTKTSRAFGVLTMCCECPFFSSLLFISLSQSTSALQLITSYFLLLKMNPPPPPLCGTSSSAVTSDHRGSNHWDCSRFLFHFFSHDKFQLFLSRL